MSARTPAEAAHERMHVEVNSKLRKLQEGQLSKFSAPMSIGGYVLDIDSTGRLVVTGPAGTITILAEP